MGTNRPERPVSKHGESERMRLDELPDPRAAGSGEREDQEDRRTCEYW